MLNFRIIQFFTYILISLFCFTVPVQVYSASNSNSSYCYECELVAVQEDLREIQSELMRMKVQLQKERGRKAFDSDSYCHECVELLKKDWKDLKKARQNLMKARNVFERDVQVWRKAEFKWKEARSDWKKFQNSRSEESKNQSILYDRLRKNLINVKIQSRQKQKR